MILMPVERPQKADDMADARGSQLRAAYVSMSKATSGIHEAAVHQCRPLAVMQVLP